MGNKTKKLPLTITFPYHSGVLTNAIRQEMKIKYKDWKEEIKHFVHKGHGHLYRISNRINKETTGTNKQL